MTERLRADTAVGPLLWRLSTLLLGAGMLVLGLGLLFSVLGLRAGMEQFSSITPGPSDHGCHNQRLLPAAVGQAVGQTNPCGHC